MKRLAALAVALGSLAAPALAHAAAPPIARPDPVTYPVKLDYASPSLPMQPLEQAVILASTTDLSSLVYEKIGDLGGFVPARVGAHALIGGGHDVLRTGAHKTQIPLFARLAGGAVSSFTFATPPSGPTPPPDNGNGPGVTPPVPPTPGNVVPPANQGFGGAGGGGGGSSSGGGGGGVTTTTRGGGGTPTTTKRPPPPPPTTSTTTTGPPPTTTTTATTTTTSGGGGGGGGGSSVCTGGSCTSGACGVPGIDVSSAPPGCTITLTNAVPGDSAQETMTITNTTGAPYLLSVQAAGSNSNHIWQDLQMEVYDASGSAPPLPWPLLTAWLGSFHALTTLNPGQSIQYVVVLYLPTTAGNADQGKIADISFNWQAQG